MIAQDVVLYERRGPAAWVTLNRPDKLNALSYELVRELRRALRLAAEDDEVKVAVLTGAGRAFSAGFDLSEEAESRVEGADRWRRILADDVELTLELWSLPKPTIAAVHGWCLAGACELAMACDLIVAAEDARFGEPEIRYGSGPVTLLMPFLLGQKKTNELLFTGDTIDAGEAERIGLVNKVLPDAELMPYVRAVATKIAQAPALSVRFIKRAVQQGLRNDLRSNLDLISSHYAVVTAGADHREAVEAFIAKRKPVFE